MVGAIFLRLAVVGTTIYGAPKKDTITWNSCSTKEFYGVSQVQSPERKYWKAYLEVCSQNAFQVYSKCQVCSKCIPPFSLVKVYSKCISQVFLVKVYSKCIRSVLPGKSVFQFYSKCIAIPSVFQMYSKCIPSVYPKIFRVTE